MALTVEAEHALGGCADVQCTQFPFNVGRQSRHGGVNRRATDGDASRARGADSTNDLNLIESSSNTQHISRGHFAIELLDGRFYLIDRGSACGTIVSGKRVGGNRTWGRTELQDGDEVIVGTHRSPYIFRFGVLPGDAAAPAESVHQLGRNT
jgi:pSer/pThr/pTyr-binding forkhead associated (FHA) protein